MIKNLLLLSVLIFAGIISHAQTENKIALSAGLGLATPSQSGIPGPVFTIKAELPLANALKLTLSVSDVKNYFGKRLYANIDPPDVNTTPYFPVGPINHGPYQFIPVLIGLRYYYVRHFYVEVSAGEAFKANVTANSFVYEGGIGGIITFGKHHAIDLGLGYGFGYKLADYNEKVNELSVRAAYRYQF